MAKKPSGPYTKGKVGTPAYRPVGGLSLSDRPVRRTPPPPPPPPVSGKKTNELPRVGGGTLRTRPRLGGELPPVSGKKPSGPYTKGKVGTPAYRPVGGLRLGGELPPVSGKKTNAIPRVGGGGGGVLRTRTPRPPRASSTSMKGGGGVQGMSKPRPYSTSMGGAGTSVQAVSGPRAKPGAGGMERFMSTMSSVLRTKTRKPTK